MVCLFLFSLQIVVFVLFYPLIVTLKYTVPRFAYSLFRYAYTMHRTQPRRRLRTKLGRPPPPFSVTIQDASFPMSPLTLSSIRIDQQSCHPTIQTSCKLLRFTRITSTCSTSTLGASTFGVRFGKFSYSLYYSSSYNHPFTPYRALTFL